MDSNITPETYISNIPAAARKQFDELRTLVRQTLPEATEVVSYGVLGYKIDTKRARVFIGGFADHVSMYPVPKDEALQSQLDAYRKGKGTLWFPLDQPLPDKLIQQTIRSLAT